MFLYRVFIVLVMNKSEEMRFEIIQNWDENYFHKLCDGVGLQTFWLKLLRPTLKPQSSKFILIAFSLNCY